MNGIRLFIILVLLAFRMAWDIWQAKEVDPEDENY